MILISKGIDRIDNDGKINVCFKLFADFRYDLTVQLGQ